jgi:predicted DNA-binding protein (MmcQ/YjbR family)
MNLEMLRDYCLNKAGVTESMPFGDDTLVFKVGNKMFALSSLKPERYSVNLKCEPNYALELREQYPEITPGYHMNKKHWNTVQLDGALDDDFILELVDQSYQLIVQSLPKRIQQTLAG